MEKRLPFFDMTGIELPELSFNNRMMTQRERRVLVGIARHIKAATITEVGIHTGFTASELLAHVPTITRYIGVDVKRSYVPTYVKQKSEIPAFPGRLVENDPRVTIIIRDRGSFDLQPNDLPTADLFLIDGDHGKNAVIHDTMLSWATVRPGGYILWHDYAPWMDVAHVMHTLYDSGADVRQIEGTNFAIRRRVSVG